LASLSSDFGLPPTPPLSSLGDETKGNSSPEHNNNSSSSNNATPAITSTSSSSKKSQSASHSTRGYSSSTRQPIHTPLISSQPKVRDHLKNYWNLNSFDILQFWKLIFGLYLVHSSVACYTLGLDVPQCCQLQEYVYNGMVWVRVNS